MVGGGHRRCGAHLHYTRSTVVDRDSRHPVCPVRRRICRIDGCVVVHRARKHERLRPLSPCWSPQPLHGPLAPWLAFRHSDDAARRLVGRAADLRSHDRWPVSFPLGLHNIGLRCGGHFSREMDSTGGACRARWESNTLRPTAEKPTPSQRTPLECRFLWLRGQDLNLRPSGYEPDELPGCSTPRQIHALFVSLVGRGFLALGRSGSDLLSRALRHSTIGAESFHVRVRNGIGCTPFASATRSSKREERKSWVCRAQGRQRMSTAARNE